MANEFYTLKDVYENLGITFIPDGLADMPVNQLLEGITPELENRIKDLIKDSGWVKNGNSELKELDFQYARHEYRTREDGVRELVVYIPFEVEGL